MSENKVSDQWLSVSDISEKTGVPVETIRRYIRVHGIHMKVKKIHKRYVIHDESLTVFQQIRELYADGKNVEEVEQALVSTGAPVTITVKTDDESMTVNMADELKRMNEQLEEQKRLSEEQAELTKLLIEKLEQKDQYIEESLERRFELLTHSLKESMKERQEQQALREMAASQEEQKKKGIWSRAMDWLSGK